MIKSWMVLFLKIVTDFVMVGFAFILGYCIKYSTVNPLSFNFTPYIKLLSFISVLWVIIFNLAGLYKLQTSDNPRVDGVFAISFGVLSAAFFTYMFVEYIWKEASYSKGIVVIASVLLLIMINVIRWAIWRIFNNG